MIKRLRVLRDLFKDNPTVVYCKVCGSIRIDTISEAYDTYNYTAILKCKNCGSEVELKGRWKTNA